MMARPMYNVEEKRFCGEFYEYTDQLVNFLSVKMWKQVILLLFFFFFPKGELRDGTARRMKSEESRKILNFIGDSGVNWKIGAKQKMMNYVRISD
jgi:hypothetical protein